MATLLTDSAEPLPPNRVDASPEKRFFVEMLVRDIDLAPAIIDLVDNSIDGAKRLRGVDALLDGLWVRLRMDDGRFAIEDNCGGISRERARNYAFKFGRPSDQPPIPGEVGQFGVGMKRALFKTGHSIFVGSRHEQDAFAVRIEVRDWLQSAEWAFPLEELGDHPPHEPGTFIEVSGLTASTARAFGQDAFRSRLRAEIEVRHVEALERGLQIAIDGRPLQARPPTLLVSDEDGLQPVVVRQQISVDGDHVDMRMWVGFATLSARGDDTDTDDPSQFRGSELAGWYVSCNDRMLLWADRSRRTGWGEEVPRYHPQYRRFRGYVALTGASRLMPWNTAKTDVEEDSPVWAEVRRHMVRALRDAVRAMNRIKREIEQRPVEDRPLVHALARAEPRRLTALDEERPRLAVPDPAPRITSDSVKVAYQVSSAVFAQAQTALEVDSAADVGRGTFAYFMRREVDPEYE